MPDIYQTLREKIIEHKGIRKYPYRDKFGYMTIGVGRNIAPSGEGLSIDECIYLLNNDIERIVKSLSVYDWFIHLSDVRQGVIIELAFNIGVAGMLEFHNMIEAIKEQKWLEASTELHDSMWARQVGEERAGDMAGRLLNGIY